MSTENGNNDSIVSEFNELSVDEIGISKRFQGIHANDIVAITRTFDVIHMSDHNPHELVLSIRYDDESGNELHWDTRKWTLDDDGETVAHSGELIEEFCRSNHFSDPQFDLEYAENHLDDYKFWM